MTRVARLIGVFMVGGLMLGLMSACGPSELERYGEAPLTSDELKALDAKIEISLGFVNGKPRLQFNESFVMPRESLVFKLPDTFLRKEALYERIEGLSVSSGGRLFSHFKEKSIKILEHPPGQRVTISYSFRPDDPITYTAEKETFSAPIIRPDYFQFVGLMALIYPIALSGVEQFSLTFEWHMPSDFAVYDSYGANMKSQTILTNVTKLMDSLFVGGSNLRKKDIDVRGRPVHIVLQGTWSMITDDELVDVVQRLLSTQREIWRDDNFPYFLISFLSMGEGCQGPTKFAGTAHINSFRAFFPNGCKLSADMKQLISHELMHMWIGKKIKVGKARGHIDGKWFTEGFTDFFGRIIAYRAGVLSEKEYFASLNRQLEKYYISNERFITLKNLVHRMYRRGYSNRALEEVPYQQGEIMAWRLNQHIKQASGFRYSLDDVIRDMLTEADRAGGSRNFVIDDIVNIVNNYAPGSMREEFSKIKYGGLLIPPKLTDCSIPQARYFTKYLTTEPHPTMDAIVYYGTRLHSCDRWLK